MTKIEAIALFGGDVKLLAEALGITRQAIYQWPDELSQRKADEVAGAFFRITTEKGVN